MPERKIFLVKFELQSVCLLQELEHPEAMYKALGTKLVVGMPFKDIATSDSIFLRSLPDSEDQAGNRALRRLQEVGVHLIVPQEELAAKPWKNSVALFALKDAADLHLNINSTLPGGAGRFAVTVDGTETEEQVAALKVSRMVCHILL